MNSNISKKFNRYAANGDSAWSEASNSSPRKQHSKFQNTNKNAVNSNKFYSKTTTYNSSTSFSTRQPVATDKTTTNSTRGIEISYQHTAEISAHLVPVDKSHHHLASSDEQIDSSPAFSPSSDSNTSDATDELESTSTSKANMPELAAQQHHYDPACYYNEYDCHQQQSQPIAYYVPYQDYSQVPTHSGSPLNTSLTGTPQPQYYHYQSIPSYIYEAQSYPVGAYSPVQPSMQQTFHHTPGNNQQIAPITSLQSPQQQQSSFLASYQTPPQPAHQLYIQTSNITPPTSLSPNDTPSTAAAGNERATDSPLHFQQQPQLDYSYQMHQYQMQPQQQDLQQPQQGQYVVPANYSPLTPQQQAYQCNSPLPSAQFMMYNPPPMIQGSPFQTGPNSPMCHTPYGANNFTPSKFVQKQRNRFNNNNNSSKRGSKFSYDHQTPQSTNSFDESTQNVYNNSPVVPNIEFIAEQESLSASNPEIQMPVYPTSSYCDPNMAMPNTEAILNAAYSNFSNIESYGEDYGDAYDENGDGDENDENLACQVCRGRRMCFCYFLKVRYYKFPSFFDLVDHQYKKWRKTMASQSLAQQQQQQQQQQQFMNSPGMMQQLHQHSPVQMNTSIGGLAPKA